MKQINNISALGFGCMRLPGDSDKSERLILHAIESGINYFDTAYLYPGKEVLLGKILHKNNLRERVQIATKLPLVMVKSDSDLDKFFDRQLERLKTDYIDYYMLHMLVSPAQLQGLFDMGLRQWVEQKKQSGKIRRFGFSFHGSPTDFIKLIDAYPWEFTMIQYNYLDTHNQAGLAGLRHAHSRKIPVIAMEPLRGGQLAVTKRIPKKAMKLFGQSGFTPAQWAMSWLFNHEEITCVLSGMRNMHDLCDNIAVADGVIKPEDFALIERVTAIFRENNTIDCTGCNYCMQNSDGEAICPVGINIPGCFMAYNSKSITDYVMNTGAIISADSTARRCIKCRKCEPLCPQSIPISDTLRRVGRRMEPFWVRAFLRVARKFTNKS
jgi:hypothetical protein